MDAIKNRKKQELTLLEFFSIISSISMTSSLITNSDLSWISLLSVESFLLATAEKMVGKMLPFTTDPHVFSVSIKKFNSFRQISVGSDEDDIVSSSHEFKLLKKWVNDILLTQKEKQENCQVALL